MLPLLGPSHRDPKHATSRDDRRAFIQSRDLCTSVPSRLVPSAAMTLVDLDPCHDINAGCRPPARTVDHRTAPLTTAPHGRPRRPHRRPRRPVDHCPGINRRPRPNRDPSSSGSRRPSFLDDRQFPMAASSRKPRTADTPSSRQRIRPQRPTWHALISRSLHLDVSRETSLRPQASRAVPTQVESGSDTMGRVPSSPQVRGAEKWQTSSKLELMPWSDPRSDHPPSHDHGDLRRKERQGFT